ncbi:MAG: hypothetical protein NZ942_01210, partial [Candidatus Aenigmarchaeota archaeon]|nr:hypothetical protein [Candidatus Aenigmarchaeota archaeon]
KEKVAWPNSKAKIYRKYKNESYTTKLHLPIEAIVILTVKEVFGRNFEKYLRWEKWWENSPKTQRAKDYKRAWEIVEKEGAENIIKDIIRTRL